MALNRQITHVTLHFINPAGTADRYFEFAMQNFNFEFEPVFYGESTTEALSGRLFQNYRGFRFTSDMRWNRSFELVRRQVGANTPTNQTFRVMFNFIIEYYVQYQRDDVRIYPGDLDYSTNENNASNYIEVVPNVIRYTQRYRDQIGMFIPIIRFRGKDVLSVIPEYFQGL